MQAFGMNAQELGAITFNSLAWTGSALTRLLTKRILPQGAHIAELKKQVQSDPSNADK